MVAVSFAVTLFVSAALLFVVQPLVGKQLLPLAGGSPGVWTTCLVFFQAALLLGYSYAHAVARSRRVFRTHLPALAAGGVLLAIGVLKPSLPILDSWEAYPVLGLSLALASAIGGPFVVLAATAPLLQAWYSRCRPAADPYPLYAASNAGSFVGLFGYPFLIEPMLTLDGQRTAWCVGFAVCAILIGLCGWWSSRSPDHRDDKTGTTPFEAIAKRRRWRWVALAALTSSLLSSVTAHLTTDIAPVPLLWVVPLGLYLLSFVLTFGRWPDRARRAMARIVPMTLAFTVVALLMRATEPLVLIAAVHLGMLFAVCLLCHGELSRDRPPPSQLTAFYLWISVGGVLGGFFNAVIAPLLFARLGPVEYPLALVVAGLVRPHWNRPLQRSDFTGPVLLAFLVASMIVLVPHLLEEPAEADEAAQLLDRVIRGSLLFGLPAAFAFALVWRPVRFALCLAVLLLVGSTAPSRSGTTLLTVRNFFGTLRVTRSADGRYMRIIHGTTLHGQQIVGEEATPTMYYHRSGPVGHVFAARAYDRIGIVGLGCGAMTAYAAPGQRWTFFEIDPNVIRLAQDRRYFTYLSQCRAEATEIILGDARRKLGDQPDGAFDLLAVDAFSSDAVPVHLLTREAFALYRARLAPGGVMLFHVSNRYLDLPPLLARLAADAKWIARWDDNIDVKEEDRQTGKLKSIWVAIARQPEDFGKLSPLFIPLHPQPGVLWTDDFSNLPGVWRQED